jgi:hypothetical protein
MVNGEYFKIKRIGYFTGRYWVTEGKLIKKVNDKE